MNAFNLLYYRERYGRRLQRLTVDGGFSCPNRDGSISTGGCTFCDNAAFHPGYTRGKTIADQLEAGKLFHQKRASDGYLAYFQAYSGTHADIDTLRNRYEEALAVPGICGLVIGTRPDIAIGRIVSSVLPRFTDAPWGLTSPDELKKKLTALLTERDSFQGRLCASRHLA